jgi:hypothetical protein
MNVVFSAITTRHSVEQDRSRTHRAWRERRVERALAVDGRGAASSILQRIHLTVQDDTSVLHASIVAAADNLVAEDDHRPNWNPALGLTPASFLNRRV